jgi:hypothetical protein
MTKGRPLPGLPGPKRAGETGQKEHRGADIPVGRASVPRSAASQGYEMMTGRRPGRAPDQTGARDVSSPEYVRLLMKTLK